MAMTIPTFAFAFNISQLLGVMQNFNAIFQFVF